MKARHLIIIMLASLGFMVGCSKYMNQDDPETSFNDQMSAFDNPAPTPDDQMPPAYDQSMNDRYQTPMDSDPMYPSNDDSAYAYADEPSRMSKPHSTRRMSGGGGGAEEVPFSETRRNKTPSNIGAL